MTLSDEVKKQAFIVGYRLGITAGKYVEWVDVRRRTRPEAIKEGAWNDAFDKVADAALAFGNAKLDKAVEELDAQAEDLAETFRISVPSWPLAPVTRMFMMAYVYIPRPILHGSGRKGRRRFPLQENGRPAYISSGSPISGASFRRVSFFSSLAAYCSRMARKRWQSEPTMLYQPLSSRSNARARADSP